MLLLYRFLVEKQLRVFNLLILIKESDVEDYDFNLPPLGFDPSDVPFGQSYSLRSNTVIGDWDPRKVLSVTQISGFAQELREYLDFLKGFDPNKPWWTTRNEEPVKVVGEGRERVAKKAGNILFPVEHPAWGGEKDISKDLVMLSLRYMDKEPEEIDPSTMILLLKMVLINSE